MLHRRPLADFCVLVAIQWLGVTHLATSEELLELVCQPVYGEPSRECKPYEHSGVQTQCISGQCVCTKLNISERVPCRPKVNKLSNIIGGPCPCTQLHAVCNVEEDICYCDTYYVPSVDRRRCLSVSVRLDNSCELDSQCQQLDGDPFTYCDPVSKQCVCKPGYTPHEGKCRALLKSKCVTDVDCGSCGDAICVTDLGKCLCSNTHVPAQNGTKCVSGAQIGEHCAYDAECQLLLGAGSMCRNGECACRVRHYLTDRKHARYLMHEDDEEPVKLCIPRPVVGSYCRESRDCEHHDVKRHEQSMKCVYGECNCREGFKTFDYINCLRSSAIALERQFMWAICIFLGFLYAL